MLKYKEGELLNSVESICHQGSVAAPDKFQTRRHSLYANNIYLCKTPYGQRNPVMSRREITYSIIQLDMTSTKGTTRVQRSTTGPLDGACVTQRE